jgi:excisionase family DNA binding protein
MKLITVDQAQEFLPIGRGRFYRAIREGWIPPGVVVHVGRRVFIDRTKFEKWAAQGGRKWWTSR